MNKWTKIVMMTLLALNTWAGESQSPYLGQKPPGKVPEPFTKGKSGNIFKLSRSITFLPDGSEAYWSFVDKDDNYKRWILEIGRAHV